MTKFQDYIIRVYGIVFNENKEVLISDEYVLDQYMVKFPGGGMEKGEGTIDCIKREAIEEFGQEIDIVNHFYTTDFYQKALFFSNKQLISVYYVIRFKENICFKISEKPFDFAEIKNGSQSFRWVSIAQLKEEDFTFPIDREVVKMIINLY